jgi:LacI family transcriptional regulator
MSDVARVAQVSVSTVSHVLNGTRKVDAETERVVREAIAAIGYVPNILARSLARSTTNTIGVAVPGITNHYFTETVQAIEAECVKHGLMMLLVDTHDDPEQEFKVVQALRERRVDGIVLAPTSHPERKVLNYLAASKLPAVLVDRVLPDPFDQVGVENIESTATLVSHLVQHGHRRIGFIAGAAAVPTSAERVQGYELALARAGIPMDPSLLRHGQSLIEPAHAVTRELLALASPPSAIVAANNMMTIGAVRAIRDAGLSIPQQIALVGFDDFDWADYFEPRLTVMAQPGREIGLKAVRLLLRRMKNASAKPQVVRLTPEIRIRRSCGCAA